MKWNVTLTNKHDLLITDHRFPCNRWIGRGVDDDSLERLLVGELLPPPSESEELSRGSRTPPRPSSPIPSRHARGQTPKLDQDRIQEMLTDAVNNIVKHFYKPEKEVGVFPDLTLFRPDTQQSTEGDCLHAPLSLPWCPWNAPVEYCNFLVECPLPRIKWLDDLALSKTQSIHVCLSCTIYVSNKLILCAHSCFTRFFCSFLSGFFPAYYCFLIPDQSLAWWLGLLSSL